MWLSERLWLIIVILPLFYSFQTILFPSRLMCLWRVAGRKYSTYPTLKAPIEIKFSDAANKLPHGYWPNSTHSLTYSFCGSGVRIRLTWVACLGFQWSSSKVSAALHSQVEVWVGEESMFKVIQVVGRIYFPCSCKTENPGFFWLLEAIFSS